MDQIAETYFEDLAVIRYHAWWPSSSDPFYQYNVPENSNRIHYYPPDCGGGDYYCTPYMRVGGDSASYLFNDWQSMIEDEMLIESPLAIELSGSYDSLLHSGELTITVIATEPITQSNLKLRVALTESNIYWEAPNESEWHNQTFRDMVPDVDGIPFSIDDGDSLTFYQAFNCPTPLVEENCELVAFVQSDDTRRILQGAKTSIMSLQYVTGYNYLPGDANMYNGIWPPQCIGSDVTYLVNYFRGNGDACELDGFWCSADANGDCNVIGSDVTRLVSYFRGNVSLLYCPDYEPLWLTPDDLPDQAPDGWPNCDAPVITRVIPSEALGE